MAADAGAAVTLAVSRGAEGLGLYRSDRLFRRRGGRVCLPWVGLWGMVGKKRVDY